MRVYHHYLGGNLLTSPTLYVAAMTEIHMYRVTVTYGKQQMADSSWEFLKIENKQIKTVFKTVLMGENSSSEGNEKQFESAGNLSYRGKFQWNFDQGKGNLVWVRGEFELSEFKFSRFYCNLKLIIFLEVKNNLRRVKENLIKWYKFTVALCRMP